MIEVVAGITYSKPKVVLLQETGIGTSEYAARTCYNSFESSENPAILNLHNEGSADSSWVKAISNQVNDIKHSDLLDALAWTHFHHSVLEHANLTYLVKGISRGVLQEHARHRIQGISVKSTRYTMQDILHAFNATSICLMGDSKATFITLVQEFGMFTVKGAAETIEISHMYEKLHHHLITVSSEVFVGLSMGKVAKAIYDNRSSYETPRELFNALKDATTKRNVGDAFKWIVTDNWKVDMVVTMNLRALKNYLSLRDSGAAYFQIRWLAEAIKDATPSKYLSLIIKGRDD